MISKPNVLDRETQVLMTTVTFLGLVPLTTILPSWIMILSFFCLALKSSHLRFSWSLPHPWLTFSLSLLSAGYFFFSEKDFFRIETLATLLALAGSLNLLRPNRYHHAVLAIFSAVFFLMLHLLESRTKLSIVLMFADLVLILSLISHLHIRDPKLRGLGNVLPSLKLLLTAIPMWLFMAVLFPRVTAFFTIAPSPPGFEGFGGYAESGFSDEIRPGSIAELTLSDEIAFRAWFAKDHPPPSLANMYWRGSVLSIGNGLVWTRSPKLERNQIAIEHLAKEWSYRVQLAPAPSQMGFSPLFLLEHSHSPLLSPPSAAATVRAFQGATFQFSSEKGQDVRYSASVFPDSEIETLDEKTKTGYSRLPANLDQRVKKLAEQIAKTPLPPAFSNLSPAEQTAQRILNWLSDNGFRYSLSSPPLEARDGVGQLSEFLFTTKIGFCEHYSAAFATLMRASGIPARIVIGYQGAALADDGETWVVRQIDSHAWTEIWIQESSGKNNTAGRWARIDPTDVVAPLRLQVGGVFNRLSPWLIAALQGLSSDEARKQISNSWVGKWNGWLMTANLAHTKWEDFAAREQAEFAILKQVRLWHKEFTSTAMPLAALLAGALAIISIALTVRWKNSHRLEQMDLAIWRTFCAQIEKQGFARKPNEGPLDFSRRAARHFPQNSSLICQIGELFAEIHYANLSASERALRTRQLDQLVRQIQRSPSRERISTSTNS